MPRTTIADIAARAGVSTAAVSYALNDKPGVSPDTRDRILEIAGELGWRPSQAARALSGARAETIGLIIARQPETLGLEAFYTQFVAGLETVLFEHSYGLLLQVVPDMASEIDAYRHWHAARRVDGIVVVDPRPDDPRLPLLSADDALPSVLVGDPSFAGGLTSVWTDDGAAMRECVRHLHQLGHRGIGRVTGTSTYGHVAIRDAAFADEAARLGIRTRVERGDFTPEAGAAGARALLTAGEPLTAIVFDSDVMALAGIGVAHELGVRVPSDVSFVGWDDSPLCEASSPRLTALGHDVPSYGAQVARRLFDRMSGASHGSFRGATPTVRERESTGPAPA